MAATSLQLRLKIWDLLSSVSLYSQLCETEAEKHCKTSFMWGGRKIQVLVLDLFKSTKQIPGILTAKCKKIYSTRDLFFFLFTYEPGFKKALEKLSKVSKFPTTPSCGCACKVPHSHLRKSSKGLHHGTGCKTMVAT